MSVIDGIKKNAKTAKWVGVLLIIAGFLAIIMPLAAGAAFAKMIGVLLAFGGVMQLLLAFRAGSFGPGLMVFVIGALTLVTGLYMISQPGVALATLALFLAAYFIVTGIAEVVSAFQVKPVGGWGWLMFGGIVSVILGIMIWRQWPLSGAWAVGVLVGIRMLMSGFELMAIGGAAGDVANALD